MQKLKFRQESMQRYYWAVYLVEYTPVSVLLERIKTGKLKTKETVIQESACAKERDPSASLC